MLEEITILNLDFKFRIHYRVKGVRYCYQAIFKKQTTCIPFVNFKELLYNIG